MNDSKWYLGFDCATKTFAFSLSRVDLARGEGLRGRLSAARELATRAQARLDAGDLVAARALVMSAAAAARDLDRATTEVIQIVDGETVDLFPGQNDKTIPSVARVQAVARYVTNRVKPAVAGALPPGEQATVIIEFQMGQNPSTRMVAPALIALFAESRVVLVGPSLKNQVVTCPQGRYCYFTEKYSNTYLANKAHAKFNFEVIEAAFGSKIPPMKPASLRGHIADSFMQVLGLLLFGPDKNAEEYF